MKKKFITVSSLILLASGMGAAFRPAFAAQNAQSESCSTSKCHAKIGKAKFVHAPVAGGECEACHVRKDKHSFEKITDVSKVCSQCHELPNGQKVVHPPVKQGNCTGCHDPHQSPYKFQLKADGSDLCFLCHNRNSILGGRYVHGPAAAPGGCTACHNPHQSEFPKMLMAGGNDLCFTCHGDKAEAAKTAKFTHPPVADACTNCHSPHSNDAQYNLPQEPTRELCFTCHSEKQQEISDATTQHKALDGPRKCLTCHDPHYADFAKQLRKAPADLCLGCHDREYRGPDGNIAEANIKDILEKNKDHHGPIREKDCSGCHNPHGSKNFRMLREYFPPLFYAPYNPDNYKLCFLCHEKSLADIERTTTLTNFRNGSRNLHFVHVNKQPKGRTCRACHDPHATNNPKHIRDAVPFSTWQLPIGYRKTETGGSCSPGCHQHFSYDRNRAVENRQESPMPPGKVF